MEPLARDEWAECVRRALAEDLGSGDVTSLATVPEQAKARARMVARESLVLAGLPVAEAVFREVSAGIELERLHEDSQRVEAGEPVLRVTGPTRAILSAERVALNFVQRLSGVATLTSRFVEAVRGTSARILDTRKTTPGLRRLEKYAVRCGGGENHRLDLSAMVLIKDNHLAAVGAECANAVAVAVARARAQYPDLRVEVEADTLAQVEQAVVAGADLILLDNMAVDQLRAAVRLVGGRAKTEASGNVDLRSVRPIAEAGVDYISVGQLTHSAPAVDIGLDF